MDLRRMCWDGENLGGDVLLFLDGVYFDSGLNENCPVFIAFPTPEQS